MRFKKLEVIEHRVAGKTDLAVNPDGFGLSLHAAELDALVSGVERHAVKPSEEIEMPPRAAKLAVGGEFQPDLFLLLDRLLDLAVFDCAHGIDGNFIPLAFGACLL